MNQIEKDIETGKQLLRAQGINLTVFKQRVNAMLTGRDRDEDMWVFLYEGYAMSFWQYKETIEEWAEEYFQMYTIEECGYQLRTKK